MLEQLKQRTNVSEEVARTELRQFIRSNARAIEAIGQKLRQGIQSNQELLTRINETNEGLARMFASLDEDRPTLLRRLNSIEQKLDQIIDQNNNQ
ncbi:MAG: hypothetical protein GVY17_01665 [Cyanobacteria bacterium]|jgi:aspartate/tyrosine/aromatic aminotransferase|nr:hypothetical protein [Cyanobacteria bacterium GSL.Bin21]